MGTTPIWANQGFYSRRGRNRPIYITAAELYNWTVDKANAGDSSYLTRFQDAMKAIASLFDGSLGTFVSPMDGQTYSYPVICNQSDILDLYMDEYNWRLITMPLYDDAMSYSDDNDVRWANCLGSFCGRIERLVRFTTPSWKRILEAMAIKYNPLADYFSKEKEIGGNAPYAGIIVQPGQTFPEVNSWTASNNTHTDYRSESETDGTKLPTTKNYTTTYDDAATGRLASYSTNEYKTSNKNEIPNSAYFKDRKVEGNDASSPQEALERELEIAQAFQDLVHRYCEDVINTEVFLSVYAKG